MVEYLELQGLSPLSHQLRRRFPATVFSDSRQTLAEAGVDDRDVLLYVSLT